MTERSRPIWKDYQLSASTGHRFMYSHNHFTRLILAEKLLHLLDPDTRFIQSHSPYSSFIHSLYKVHTFIQSSLGHIPNSFNVTPREGTDPGLCKMGSIFRRGTWRV